MKVQKSSLIAIVVVLVITCGVIGYLFFMIWNKQAPAEPVEIPLILEPAEPEELVYSPVIDPVDFSTEITNQYFTLTPGNKWIYQAKTEEGTEVIEVFVTDEIKEVMGVMTRVVWDRVWLNGELIEDTRDWYAQDSQGNVWYFGEESKDYAQGQVVSTKGSWESGIDGALPGILMLAEPAIAEVYRQEYYAGEAEDMGEILAMGESVTTPLGTYPSCLKTKDWNPLEDGSEEHKFYAPEVGNVVLELALDDGERVELVQYEQNATASVDVPIETEDAMEEAEEPAPVEESVSGPITQQQAIEIAQQQIQGTFIKVESDNKFGKEVFAVAIEEASGVEKEAIIDKATGEVLAVEVQ